MTNCLSDRVGKKEKQKNQTKPKQNKKKTAHLLFCHGRLCFLLLSWLSYFCHGFSAS